LKCTLIQQQLKISIKKMSKSKQKSDQQPTGVGYSSASKPQEGYKAEVAFPFSHEDKTKAPSYQTTK
jgi:hypothetical protein